MPENATSSVSVLELAVRVGVLESQVSGLTNNLQSHQTYVATEFANVNSKLESQNKIMAANHKENKDTLSVVVSQSQELLARTHREDGAEDERVRIQNDADRRKAARQPYITTILGIVLGAIVTLVLWHAFDIGGGH